MFYVAMRMAGITYVPNGPLPANLEDLKKMRYYFNQFGLGVKTGIDLPQESAGMQTNPKIVGVSSSMKRSASLTRTRLCSSPNMFQRSPTADTGCSRES